jgi:hypothetical protein
MQTGKEYVRMQKMDEKIKGLITSWRRKIGQSQDIEGNQSSVGHSHSRDHEGGK